jgi:diguanylate cyclase (GGDEF)-like protein
MEALSWIDNRTLLGCQFILLAVYTAMLIGMRLMNPGLAGIQSIIAGFALGLPVIAIMTAGDAVPFQKAMLIGGAFVLLSSLCLCRGVLQFCHGKKPTPELRLLPPAHRRIGPAQLFPVLCGLSSCTMLAIVYFTQVRINPTACVMALTGTLALTRGLMSWSLLRCAAKRALMRAFGISMGVFALLTAVQTIKRPSLAAGGLPSEHIGYILPILLSLAFFCVQGAFYLLMFAGHLTESEHEDARHDHLLGTLNRRGIEASLLAEIARTRRTRSTFSVLLIDIDHFKSVNDRFGHMAGDESLRLITQGINQTVRADDVLGRYGGDEFLLLLPATDCNEALLTAARIRETVTAGTAEFAAGPMTMSIGITCCSMEEDMLEIVTRADAALYEAKRDGRDCARTRMPREAGFDSVPASSLLATLPRGAETV